MITNEVSSRVRPIISARRSSASLPTTAVDTREKRALDFFCAAAARGCYGAVYSQYAACSHFYYSDCAIFMPVRGAHASPRL
jgi:hypothetical protein